MSDAVRCGIAPFEKQALGPTSVKLPDETVQQHASHAPAREYMAHIRRKFVDVLQSQGLAVSEAAIPRIAELYAVEKDARGLQPEERVRLHQSRSKSLPDDLEIWTTAQVAQIADDKITRLIELMPWRYAADAA
ncbi:IS66 family transposase [Phaeobacter inhibens]|uniref:IS66 family transposase n=1 Tax=Phaeobacter inhibens TaxID=221822 RepID=UPI0021A33B99|nr:transposase [Phaeobacter inhibens]